MRPRLSVCASVWRGKTGNTTEVETLSETLARRAWTRPSDNPDVCLLLYTSGSTGSSKGGLLDVAAGPCRRAQQYGPLVPVRTAAV